MPDGDVASDVPRAARGTTSRFVPARQRRVAPVDFFPHVAARGAVRRDRVVRRLQQLPEETRLVLLTAPAGYGKTTAVRQWVEIGGHPFRWLRLDAASADPARLAQSLAAILGGAWPPDTDLPGSGPDVPRSPTEANAELAERLAAVFRAAGPLVIVLDELERVRSRHSLDLVTGLAERLPRDSRVVVLADRRPRWQVGRLVAQGRYAEFGVDDLAFTPTEAEELLDDAGLGLPADAVAELVRRTEGWPLGLRLAVGTLTQVADPVTAVWRISGDAQPFAEYFREEVLSGLSVETVRFLMQTALLDRMTGSLCDAALGTTGSATRLASARALGLFVRSEDDHGEWYRYERLFAEMLRAELRRREPGADLRVLRRASEWYEEHHRPAEAVEYALAAGGTFTAARLIVANAQDVNSRGEVLRVRGWLEQLDRDALELYPPLAVMAAWVWALTGDAARARAALRSAESASFDGSLPDGGVSLESAVMRARAALAPEGVERMLIDAERGVALEPPGSRWHTQAALLLGAAHMVNGAEQEALRWYEQAARFGRREQRPGALTALAEQALLAAANGDWSLAEVCLRDSVELRVGTGLEDYMPALTAYLAAARVALHRGDTSQAIAHVQMASALYEAPSPEAFPWLAVQAAVTIGHLQLELGNAPDAEQKLADARRHLSALSTTGALAGWVDELASAVDGALLRTPSPAATRLTGAELRVLRRLPTHLSLAQIADELVVSRHTVKAQVASIYLKLGADSRSDAVRLAEQKGLLNR